MLRKHHLGARRLLVVVVRAVGGLSYTAPGLREVVHDVREIEGWCSGIVEALRCGLKLLEWVVGFVVDGSGCWMLRVESSCLKVNEAWTRRQEARG
jgi:hypothetical protein